LSPLSDRLGHRRIVLIATITVGVFTLATLLATNAAELMVLRCLIAHCSSTILVGTHIHRSCMPGSGLSPRSA
jgi:MFS family permease